MTSRIAIVGGDDRASRASWPKGYDLRFFAGARSGGTREMQRLADACQSGKINFVVWLSRWNAHSAIQMIKGLAPLVIWERGIGELAKALPEIAKQKGIVASDGKAVEVEEKWNGVAEATPSMTPPSPSDLLFPLPVQVSSTPSSSSISSEWSADEVAALELAMERNLDDVALLTFFHDLSGSDRSYQELVEQRQRLEKDPSAERDVEPLLPVAKNERRPAPVAVVATLSPPQRTKVGRDSTQRHGWLSQGEAARKGGLTRDNVFAGFVSGKIRRCEGLGGAWLYSVADVMAYAVERDRLGDVATIYEKIVGFAENHHEDLLRGEARGIGRYVSLPGVRKRVVAILTSTFASLVSTADLLPRRILGLLHKQGLLIPEAPGRYRRKVGMGGAYRPYAYYIILPGTAVDVGEALPPLPPPPAEPIDEEVEAAPEASPVEWEVEAQAAPSDFGLPSSSWMQAQDQVSADTPLDEWLPQGEVARRSGLHRNAISTGFRHDEIRRQRDEDTATWHYCLNDAILLSRTKGITPPPADTEQDRVVFEGLSKILPEQTSQAKPIQIPTVTARSVRGQTEVRVLQVMSDHPGSSADEIAALAGITTKHVSVMLCRFSRTNRLRKEGPNRWRRYFLTDAADAPAAATTDEVVGEMAPPSVSLMSTLDDESGMSQLSDLLDAIEAVGKLVDTGMLDAEDAVVMIRKKAAKLR